MSRQLTAEDARQSLTDHVTNRGLELFLKYGPGIGLEDLARLLEDRTFVRYPCELVFGTAGLQAGELAHPEPRGEGPDAGFTLFVHPAFAGEPEAAVAIALYQLVAVNYGDFAAADDAECFGAAALALTRDEYYAQLCRYADRVGPAPAATPLAQALAEAPPHPEGGCGCGGGCGH